MMTFYVNSKQVMMSLPDITPCVALHRALMNLARKLWPLSRSPLKRGHDF